MKENTSIKVCGKSFDTGTRVVLWNEPGGMSFYPGGKYGARNFSLKELRNVINSFYIHHSVTYHAQSTFRVLKIKGLSCVFIIDDDINEDGCATIYQLLDVKDYGFSQGGIYNRNGAGVELSYYPDAWDHPNRYSEYNKNKWGVQDHNIVPDKVNRYKFKKVFAPTDAQIKACIHLISGYKKAFPNLELKFPRDEDGNFLSKTVNENQKYGLLHHFNVTRRKVDALGFPTDYVEEEVNRMHKEELMKRKNIIDKIFGWLK